MTATSHARLVVVGSGIAGLTAGLRAVERGLDVVLLSKDELAESSTNYAQGGIAAMTAGLPPGQPRDTAELHARDTLAAGAGMCDDDAVRVLVRDSAAAVDELVARGVHFDRIGGPGSAWVEGLEGAHSVPRILHAGGDATGREIERALVEAALAAESAGRLEILRRTMLADLVLTPGGRVRGALVLELDHVRELDADAVVLATGGAGQLYPHTTNPAVATGDGIAAALRAGAAVADLEFVQFHPTALAVPGCFLVSEAVRGEGAVLRDDTGKRFLGELHPLADLAPRDVVARENARRALAQGGRPVVLDCTGIVPPADGPHASSSTAEFLARRFPTIDAAVRAHGVDWSREPVPVTPAAHYLMGGIATDSRGRTTVPGLYAVGECAATGVHGANRLASNSLLEGAVFGRRVVDALETDLGDDHGGLRIRSAGRGPGSPMPRLLPVPLGNGVPFDRAAFQEAMWTGAGVLRDGPGLEALSRCLAGLRAPVEDVAAEGSPPSRGDLEDRNLLTVGRAVAAAALHRTESRGAHFRDDFPSPVPARARRTFWRPERPVAPVAPAIPGIQAISAVPAVPAVPAVQLVPTDAYARTDMFENMLPRPKSAPALPERTPAC